MSLLSVKGLSAGYGRAHVLNDIYFSVSKGSITGVLGANGSGKSTLLKAICSILPHEGSCVLSNAPMDKLSPRHISKLCSYIPQRSGISIDLSVLDVVLMGFNSQLALLEQPGVYMRSEALAALKRVGLEGKTDCNYMNLSEGEKQLCILARALVSRGKLLLLDEPESSLDLHHRRRMLDLIRGWIDDGERCALIALHDPMLALECCDQLLLLRDGTLHSVIHPAHDDLSCMETALSDIFGSINLIRCTDRSGYERLVMLKMQEEKQ